MPQGTIKNIKAISQQLVESNHWVCGQGKRREPCQYHWHPRVTMDVPKVVPT